MARLKCDWCDKETDSFFSFAAIISAPIVRLAIAAVTILILARRQQNEQQT